MTDATNDATNDELHARAFAWLDRFERRYDGPMPRKLRAAALAGAAAHTPPPAWRARETARARLDSAVLWHDLKLIAAELGLARGRIPARQVDARAPRFFGEDDDRYARRRRWFAHQAENFLRCRRRLKALRESAAP